MTPTANQIARFTTDVTKMAKEAVYVELVKGTFYVLGTEVACLRIFEKYNRVVRNDKTAFGYSENLKSFYFRLELA